MLTQLIRFPVEILRKVARTFTGGRPVRETLRSLFNPSAEEPSQMHGQTVSFDPEPPGREPEAAPEPVEAAPEPVEAAPEPVLVTVVATPTPNPNAMKFTCSVRVVERGSLSFTNAESAKGNVLGEALFALPGVRIVFAVNDFVSVTKQTDISWIEIMPDISALLVDVLGAQAAAR